MKKRFLATMVAATTLVMSGVGMAGCKPEVVDSDQHLEIYVLNIGLGYEWAPAIADAFSKESWVQEKYPEFSYSYDFNDEWDFASDRIKAGKAINTADILFGNNLQTLYNTKKDGELVLTSLEEIAKETVLGEEVVYEEKLYPEFLTPNKSPDTDELVTVPWGIGYQGLLYNETLLTELGFEVPVTTKEFLDICQAIKTRTTDETYGENYAVIGCYNDDYWQNAFPIWWAQYEGVEEYTNFFQGISEGKLSKDIFLQTGRLKALEALHDTLSKSNGYTTENSGIYEFMDAQTNFLMGKGVFYMCGDWFDYEMRAIAPGLKKTYDYDIRLMQMPVLSSVREKTSIDSDEKMAELIREIDAGKAYAEISIEGISQKDYNTVKTARSIQNLGGGVTNMAVPSYATAKELALDFVRYFATDKAQEIFARTTYGGSTGFKYDPKTKNEALYNELSLLNRDKYDILNGEITILPGASRFPLVYKGGLTSTVYMIAQDSFAHMFGTTTKTAKEFFDYDAEYMTTDRWNMMLSMTGY